MNAIKGNAFYTAKLTLDSSFEKTPQQDKGHLLVWYGPLS